MGQRVFPRLAPTAQRLYDIVLNNSLTPEINGEYWLLERLRQARVLLDVGFHRGEWSFHAARRFPDAAIYAFDPWPRARTFLEASELQAGIQLFGVALSNYEGSATFYDYDSGCNSLTLRDVEAAPLVGTHDVDVTTLDSWCALYRVDQIDYLKIDAEGHDLAVLEGARDLLKRGAISAFSFEYADGWIAARRYLAEADRFVRECGYSLFKLFPEFLAPFVYNARFETFHGAMFVGLSPAVSAEGVFPIRLVHGL
jgi:FkbM family methyltransferase